MLRKKRQHLLSSAQLEIMEVKTRGDGAAHKAVSPLRARRLPPSRGNGTDRLAAARKRAKGHTLHAVERRRGHEELDRPAFAEVPDLVRTDPVPPAVLPRREQEVDAGDGRARRAFVAGPHLAGRAVDLAEDPPFGVGIEPEPPDKRICSWIHLGVPVRIL